MFVQVSGEITYNGRTFGEFLPQSTAVYVPQDDQHMGELTVRETFNFAARCQGAGIWPGKPTTPSPTLSVNLMKSLSLSPSLALSVCLVRVCLLSWSCKWVHAPADVLKEIRKPKKEKGIEVYSNINRS